MFIYIYEVPIIIRYVYKVYTKTIHYIIYGITVYRTVVSILDPRDFIVFILFA